MKPTFPLTTSLWSKTCAACTVALLWFTGSGLGCSSDKFSSCGGDRTCPGSPGDGGSGGSSDGGSGGDVGGSGNPSGGSAGDPGASGGGSGDGGGSAGAAGDDAGGSSGSGGDTDGSGGEPEPECDGPEDCDDELFCNGFETCEEGVCVDGTASCVNPDAAHCQVECVEGEVDARCEVSALDGDNDGHGTKLCEVAPGDDCDDAHQPTHPGAAEVCDGRDNNCDGAYDLQSTEDLSGSNLQLKIGVDTGIPAIAWSSGLERFLVAYGDNGLSALSLLSATGAEVGSVSLGPPTNPQEFDVAAGPTQFGLGRDWTFDVVGVSGNTLSLGSGGSVSGLRVRSAWIPGGPTWTYSDTGAMLRTTIGGLRPASAPTSSPQEVGLAVRGNTIGVLQTGSDGSQVQFWTTQLVGAASAATRLNLTDDTATRDPELFATDRGFAAFWHSSDTTVTMVEVGEDGTKLCGPVSFPSLLNSNIAFDGTSFVQIAEVLGSLRISRILPGCNVTGENVAITPSMGVPIYGADVTMAPNGFAIVWLECANQACALGADARLNFRLLAKNLCR